MRHEQTAIDVANAGETDALCGDVCDRDYCAASPVKAVMAGSQCCVGRLSRQLVQDSLRGFGSVVCERPMSGAVDEDDAGAAVSLERCPRITADVLTPKGTHGASDQEGQ